MSLFYQFIWAVYTLFPLFEFIFSSNHLPLYKERTQNQLLIINDFMLSENGISCFVAMILWVRGSQRSQDNVVQNENSLEFY